ncbi:Coatomer subunit beta [Binucleata daphniae]
MHKIMYLTTNETKNITTLLTTSPSDALKQLIANESQGINTSEYINSTIKTILQTKPTNQTLKLFYTYISLIPKKDKDSRILGEVLLLTNQIRKDLQSMNEYIRGVCMQSIISFLELPDVIDNFYKPIKDNITHKHSYVRKWAAHLLGEFYITNNEKYQEVVDIIYNSLILEQDTFCMRQMLTTLYKIAPHKAINYKPTDVPEIVSEVIINNTNDLEYIKTFVNKNTYYAGLCLLKKYMNNQTNKHLSSSFISSVIDSLLNCKRNEDALKFIIDLDFDTKFLKGYLTNILKITKKNESLYKHPNLIELLFEIANTNEINILLDEFLLLLKESSLKLYLIQKLNYIFNFYAITSNDITEEIQKCINNDDPAISYESLKFLSEQKNALKTIQLENIKYGKIFRKALNILKNSVHNEKEAMQILVLFESKLENNKDNAKLANKTVLNSLYNDSTPFIGCSVSLFFSSLNKKIKLSDDFKARTIALLLKFIIQGEQTKKMDKSSHTLMLMCIKSIYTPDQNEHVNNTVTESNVNNSGFLSTSCFDTPLHFSLLGRQKKQNTQICIPVITTRFCKPLTAISDPVYLEANITINKFNILIDIIVINQTDSLLQNLTFDFTTSSNLLLQSQTTPLPNLVARSVKNILFTYSIQECADAFLCGNLKFNFLNDKKQFSGSFYTVNLEEIKFDIKDFLSPSLLSNELNFREEWIKLEWENTYSVKLNYKKNLCHLRNLLCEKLKGKVLSEEGDNTYLVSNIICGTLLGNDILINILMSVSDLMNLECRIRSKSENVVKSVSNLISEGIKEIV